LGLTTGAALVGWVVSGIAMIIFEGMGGIMRLPVISLDTWVAVLYLGLLLGVLMYLLIQFGVKHGLPVVAASMGYISTFVTGVSGVLFLKETISSGFVFGGSLVLIGVFITSIVPILRNRSFSR